MPRHKVQCWVLSQNASGETICLLLKTNAARGQFWQPVTGSVEKGETFDDGARRELEEETGFDFSSAQILYTGYEFEFSSRFGQAKERVYAVKIPKQADPKLDPREHEAFEWILASKAAAKLKFDTNKTGLERSLKTISRPN